jgi:serine/threonine protein kinase
MLLPSTKVYGGKTYSFHKLLGKGSAGEVGLYTSPGADPIVIKAQFCGDKDAEAKGQREAQTAKSAAEAVGACPTSVSRCAGCSLSGDGMIRMPLATEYQAPCSLAIYPYFQKTLADWLADTETRAPAQVVSLFQQLLGIVLCLGSKGYYYTDLKPANFLVSGPAGAPRLAIGDLGGLDTADMKQIVVTPGRLPAGMAQGLDVSQLDQVTAYLLGGMALELLARPSRGPDAAHPVDGFFDCLRRPDKDTDSCVRGFLDRLQTSMARGLDLKDPRVSSLAAAALTLLGYQKNFLPAKSAAAAFDKAVA